MTPDEKIRKITEDTNASIRKLRSDAHAQTADTIQAVLLQVLPTTPTKLSDLQALAKDAGLTTKTSMFRIIMDSLVKEGKAVAGQETMKPGRSRLVFHKPQ